MDKVTFTGESMECTFDSQNLLKETTQGITVYSTFPVSNCRGHLLATPVTQYVPLRAPFPDYTMLYIWNISATNRLSGLRITVKDNMLSSEHHPNCHQMRVFLFPGKGLFTMTESVSEISHTNSFNFQLVREGHV